MARLNTNLLFFIIVLYSYQILIQTYGVEITIKQGKLAGTVLKSRNGANIYAFLGIPFTKPPIGELRFESPQEPDAWDDVRNATVLPPICVQEQMVFIATKVRGQEDCLYLNVYTPSVTDSTSLPVMVFIHGGAFLIGSGSDYQPDYLLDQPVVLVTFNYRLGSLGFLSASDEVIPGNYGMKDQVAALKWIQKNIASFGGNPNKVTIFGESAGGASVHLHLYSSLGKGLFQQAIAQSGSALNFWAQISPDLMRQRTRTFGVLTGCPTKSTRALLKCLKEIPVEDIYRTQCKYHIWNLQPIVPFGPVIELESVVDAFLVENVWKQEVINDVPFISGINSEEGGIMTLSMISNNYSGVHSLNEHFNRIVPYLLFEYGHWLPTDDILKVTESIRKFYFGDEEMGKKTVKNISDFISDGLFTYSILEGALRCPGKKYFYYYDHRNLKSTYDFFPVIIDDLGAAHSDELTSLFPSIHGFPAVTDGPDFQVSQRMVNYWTNFAKTGNPNGEEDIWKPLKSNELEYLHITTKEDAMKANLLRDRYLFWKSLRVDPTYSANDLRVFTSK